MASPFETSCPVSTLYPKGDVGKAGSRGSSPCSTSATSSMSPGATLAAPVESNSFSSASEQATDGDSQPNGDALSPAYVKSSFATSELADGKPSEDQKNTVLEIELPPGLPAKLPSAAAEQPQETIQASPPGLSDTTVIGNGLSTQHIGGMSSFAGMKLEDFIGQSLIAGSDPWPTSPEAAADRAAAVQAWAAAMANDATARMIGFAGHVEQLKASYDVPLWNAPGFQSPLTTTPEPAAMKSPTGATPLSLQGLLAEPAVQPEAGSRVAPSLPPWSHIPLPMPIPASPMTCPPTPPASSAPKNPNSPAVKLDLAEALPEPKLGSPEQPTVGSASHRLGNCKPCAFLYTKGCMNGVECPFCHLCDTGEKKRRQKEKREQRRELCRWAGVQAAFAMGGTVSTVPR